MIPSLCVLCVFLLAASPPARAQEAVDLSTWTAESYPAVSGFGAGVWTVSGDGHSVVQSVNGQPTFFYSDFNAFNSELEGVITAVSSGDDDFIGFALGFRPGDAMGADAEYLLIDWKAATQAFDFGSPSCTPGGTAPRGLAVSRVSGIPTADEFWTHGNFLSPACSDENSGLEQIARGNTRGDTPWQSGVDYTFRFQFSATSLKVYVDDVLELDITGDFADGRFAFYNFSQQSVTYRGFQKSALGPVARCRDVTVAAGTACGADADIDNGSYDPDEGPVALTQTPPGPYPVGETEVTLTVTDGDQLSTECTATVTVTETVPPEITCPPNVAIEVPPGETVPAGDPRLDAFTAGAADNCDPSPVVTDDAPPAFAAGVIVVTFTATDASGNTATCTATVTVTEAGGPSPEPGLDIHPGSCPNPLAVRKQGVIPAALLGTADFDVADIDAATLLLEGVPPLRHGYEDVGAPSAGEPCDCGSGDEDGHTDLTLKFPAPAVVAALGEVADGEHRVLTLTGNLVDGTPFEAQDCMLIRANGIGAGDGTYGPPDGESVAFTVLSYGTAAGTQRIDYTLPEALPVTLTVYTVTGRVVRRLVSAVEPAGTHTVDWNPDGVSNGIYFYRLDVAGRSITRKAVLIR
jgi:hypothetical protein